MTSPRARALALTVAATATALVLAGCGDDDPKNTASDPGSSDDATSSPADGAPTSEPSQAESSGVPETVTVPIYFVGDGPDGPVLFREFRAVEADNPMAEALALLAAGDALDRDYRTPFPDGASFKDDASYDESILVNLADDTATTRPQGMSTAEAKVSVQALVYTLQGIVQNRSPVSVHFDGRPTTLLGIDTSGGVKAAPELDVLNLVSVTTPEEGRTVSGSFTASGVASSFEATVPWEIRQGDQVVKEGFATAEGWLEKLYPWETEVDVSDLAPGEYTFVALTDDPSGGEGRGPSEDSKTIIVG